MIAAPPKTALRSRAAPNLGFGFDVATRAALVAVLLAQAVAIVVAEPWPEGAILLVLSRGHGVTMGDLPAVMLVLVALATFLLSLPRVLNHPFQPRRRLDRPPA